MDEVVDGVDPAVLTGWMRERELVAGDGPVDVARISGGHSNLTYRVTDEAGAVWALRRPPTGGVLATAHDMSREWRFISTLAPTPVPVPEPVAYCDDADVIGAEFYLMGFVDGVVPGDPESGERAAAGAPADVRPGRRRRARRPARRRPGRGRARRPAPPRQLPGAPAAPLAPAGARERDRGPVRGRRGARAADRADAGDRGDPHRARRLPAGEPVVRRRRADRGDLRLGAGDARRAAGRPGLGAGVVGAAGGHAAGDHDRADRRRRLARARRGRAAATPSGPAGTCPSCRTSWRSRAGARRASAPASTPGTSAGNMGAGAENGPELERRAEQVVTEAQAALAALS